MFLSPKPSVESDRLQSFKENIESMQFLYNSHDSLYKKKKKNSQYVINSCVTLQVPWFKGAMAFITAGCYISIQQSAVLFHFFDLCQEIILSSGQIKREKWFLVIGLWLLCVPGHLTMLETLLGQKHTEDKRAADPSGHFYSSQIDK